MAAVFALFFLIFHYVNATNNTSSMIKGGFLTILENKLENTFADYALDGAKWLESYNDEKFKNSGVAKLLKYEELKPKLNDGYKYARGMNKMSLMLVPLFFHMGVAATWLMITGIMAAKSVAIGITLLIFKIAVSSAKVASFFTAWKGKHHHGWEWTPPHAHHDVHDHHDHHDYLDHHDVHSYSPEWSPPLTADYKTLPDFHYSEPYAHTSHH